MVANRHGVVVDLWPFNLNLSLPLYLVFFAGLFLGLLLAWIIMLYRRLQAASEIHSARRESVRLRSQLMDLEKALDEMRPEAKENQMGEDSEQPTQLAGSGRENDDKSSLAKSTSRP